MLVHRTSHTLHLHGEATTIEDGPCTAEILEDAIRKAEDRGKKIGAKQACAKMEADVISAEEDKQKASAIVEDKNKASAILENKEAAMATEKSESDVVVALISILVILVMALSGCAWYWLRVGKWSCPSVPGNCSGLGLGCAKCLKDCLSWMKGGQGGTHGGRPPEEDPESFVTDANGHGEADQRRDKEREGCCQCNVVCCCICAHVFRCACCTWEKERTSCASVQGEMCTSPHIFGARRDVVPFSTPPECELRMHTYTTTHTHTHTHTHTRTHTHTIFWRQRTKGMMSTIKLANPSLNTILSHPLAKRELAKTRMAPLTMTRPTSPRRCRRPSMD